MRGRPSKLLLLLIVSTAPDAGAGAPRVTVAVPAAGPSMPEGEMVNEVISKGLVAVVIARTPRPSYAYVRPSALFKKLREE